MLPSENKSNPVPLHNGFKHVHLDWQIEFQPQPIFEQIVVL